MIRITGLLSDTNCVPHAMPLSIFLALSHSKTFNVYACYGERGGAGEKVGGRRWGRFIFELP